MEGLKGVLDRIGGHLSDGLTELREKARTGDTTAAASLATLEAAEAAEAERVASACPTCGPNTPGWVRADVGLDHPDFGKAQPCPTCRKAVPKVDYLRTRLPKKLRHADTDPDRAPPEASSAHRRAKDVAMRTVMAWGASIEDRPAWLVLVGPYGTGKSRAGARAMIERAKLGQLGAYVRVPDLLGRLRGGMTEGAYEELIEGYRECPLLFVDDLGVENFTRWTDEALFRILDHRYSEELPTIIASNVSPTKLEGRVSDRMRDPSVSEVVKFEWPSYRRPEKDEE